MVPKKSPECVSMAREQNSLAVAVAERKGQKQALEQHIIALTAEINALATQGAILSPQWVRALVETQELSRSLAEVDVAIRDLLVQIEAIHTRAVSAGCEPRNTDHSIDDALAKHLQQAADAHSELLREVSILR